MAKNKTKKKLSDRFREFFQLTDDYLGIIDDNTDRVVKVYKQNNIASYPCMSKDDKVRLDNLPLNTTSSFDLSPAPPIVEVKFIPMCENFIIPKSMTDGAGGYDLFFNCTKSLTIQPGETRLIYSRFAMEIPPTFEAVIYSRSGMALNNDITISYPTPLLDSDHRGQFIIPLKNNGDIPFEIKPGDAIAQLALHERYKINFVKVDKLSETERGSCGLGSTSSKPVITILEEDNEMKLFSKFKKEETNPLSQADFTATLTEEIETETIDDISIEDDDVYLDMIFDSSECEYIETPDVLADRPFDIIPQLRSINSSSERSLSRR